ncbi:MAG: 3,5-cyclic phosphodiesterase CpdA [Hydrocarboniphaga sp.]|uniref:metallophosphoesterase family protein n=1 Tax=Hydrocarboniphaga sp. TaxID=2033016 RepID=UPI002610739B|nr:metallophosphoesterase [Hydrocarboniphaga sp.]MDB5968142.1 3,5-cyclic phosphodiesterase CpdA [Hydrocarboniphaga sp.]
MTATTLAHFSDPHLAYEPRLSLAQRFSKRQLSALSWARGRSKSQQHDLLERLVADVRAAAPDHWAITGDIANFSLPGEFPAAAAWLSALAPAGQVSVVPGNHDALVALEHRQGWGLWQPWMSNDDGSESWPYVRERGDIALIGVSSALPTPPLLASGRVGAAQLQRLEQRLGELGRRGLCRVLMIHHPVASGAISARKALRDAAELRAVIKRAGVELVLHGHARDARLDALAGPAGVVPCLGLPSASAAPGARDAGARWQLLRIQRRGEHWQLEQRVRLWDATAQAFVCAGRYRFDLPRQHAR